MIIVLGEVTARAETADEIHRLSREHVLRSRGEPGCLAHDVQVDVHNPLRLAFVERWADEAALRAHFVLPASRAFARALGALAAHPPAMQIYTAAEVTL